MHLFHYVISNPDSIFIYKYLVIAGADFLGGQKEWGDGVEAPAEMNTWDYMRYKHS